MRESPEWSEEDQDLALAWEFRQQRTCNRCGTRPEEWLDEEGKPIWPPPFEPVKRECKGCRAIEGRERAIEKHETSGAYVYLVPFREDVDPEADLT